MYQLTCVLIPLLGTGLSDQNGGHILLAKPRITLSRSVESLDGCRLVKRFPLSGIIVLKAPAGESSESCLRRLRSNTAYEYVEPDRVCRPISLPDDPSFPAQWHLMQAGLPGAWTMTVGSSSAPIAIVDTGVDTSHPDLQNRLPGYNAMSGTPEVLGGDVSDSHGHGTMVAGVACATGNNGIGGTGVGWSIPYIPVKVSNSPTGSANMSAIIAGIEWAATHGAKVINVSMTGVEDNLVNTVGDACWNLGIMTVWGAGNDGIDTRNLPQFPSDWDYRHVIVVGATDPNDNRWALSNYGKAIDVLAPGVNIITTARGGGMTQPPLPSGTSFSAAMVSGTLALQFAYEPGLSLEEAEFRLERTAFDLGSTPRPGQPGFDPATYRPGNDAVYGWGRINASEALQPSETRYDIQRVPLLPGRSSWGTSINDRSDVGGDYFSSSGNHSPYLWMSGAPTATLLPTFSGVPDQTRLVDINNNRQALLYVPGTVSAAIWSSGSGLSPFDPPPPGFSQIWPLDMNDDALVAGFVQAGSVTSPRLWINGQAQSGRFWEDWQQATSVNRWGDIAGQGNGKWLVALENGDFRETPTQGFAYQISDGGTVVGGGSLAALWLSDGSVHQMASPVPGEQLYLNGVNESDVAVGWVTGTPTEAVVADLLHGPRTLLSLARTVQGFSSLTQALKVNNLGQIVGTGIAQANGLSQGFIAHPVREVSGEFPIYLGALPPAFAVEFRRHDRTPWGPPQTALFDQGARTLRITIPQFVTGPFHVYLRLSNQVGDPYAINPPHFGSGWLGWLYPPANYSPLPLDTRSIPLGDLVGTDIDSDNEIGIGDYAALSAAYGSQESDPNWNRAADLARDDVIDIADYALISATYGREGDP